MISATIDKFDLLDDFEHQINQIAKDSGNEGTRAKTGEGQRSTPTRPLVYNDEVVNETSNVDDQSTKKLNLTIQDQES